MFDICLRLRNLFPCGYWLLIVIPIGKRGRNTRPTMMGTPIVLLLLCLVVINWRFVVLECTYFQLVFTRCTRNHVSCATVWSVCSLKVNNISFCVVLVRRIITPVFACKVSVFNFSSVFVINTHLHCVDVCSSDSDSVTLKIGQLEDEYPKGVSLARLFMTWWHRHTYAFWWCIVDSTRSWLGAEWLKRPCWCHYFPTQTQVDGKWESKV